MTRPCNSPTGDTFDEINEFVHGDVNFEELQGALVSLARKHEKLRATLRGIDNPEEAIAKAREALKEAASTILTARIYLPKESDDRSRVIMKGAEITRDQMCELTVSIIKEALAALTPKP